MKDQLNEKPDMEDLFLLSTNIRLNKTQFGNWTGEFVLK